MQRKYNNNGLNCFSAKEKKLYRISYLLCPSIMFYWYMCVCVYLFMKQLKNEINMIILDTLKFSKFYIRPPFKILERFLRSYRPKPFCVYVSFLSTLLVSKGALLWYKFCDFWVHTSTNSSSTVLLWEMR